MSIIQDVNLLTGFDFNVTNCVIKRFTEYSLRKNRLRTRWRA